MKKYHFILILISFCFALLLSSCEGPVGPQGSSGKDGDPGPKLTGSIAGFVYLADPDTLYFDHHGVSIQIENSLFETTTDSNGKWRINDLETGIYNILVKKNGFTNYKYNSVQFNGGGEYFIGTRYIASLPQIQLTIDTVYSNPFGVSIQGQRLNDIDGASSYYGIIFWGVNDSVSSNPENYNFRSEFVFNFGSYTYSIYLSKDRFLDVGFQSGDMVYVTIYGSIRWSNSLYGLLYESYFRYLDVSTNKFVSPFLGEKSETFSVQIP